jgi:hypothetical protein
MARRQKKYHYIYKTTCNVNGKFYIGMHSTENLNDGYLGSGRRIWNSINYHGKENHKKEIIEFCLNREELKKREKEIVNADLINDHFCMNLQLGGGGGFINEEHMMKVSKAGNKEFLEKMKDDEYRKEFSKKMSELNKKSFELGTRERKYFYDWTGKKHTNDTKLKLSLKNKNKGVGSDNSVWGRKWMNKDFKNKMVKSEEIEFHISDGWLFGIFIDEKKKSQLKESFEKIRHLSGPSCVGRKWINKKGVNKRVVKEDLNKYLNDGWVLGCIIKKPI